MHLPIARTRIEMQHRLSIDPNLLNMNESILLVEDEEALQMTLGDRCEARVTSSTLLPTAIKA